MDASQNIVEKNDRLPFSKWGWIVSLLTLIVLIVLVVMNIGKAEHFVELLRQAKPWWLLLAILLQLGTYMCAGAVWRAVTLSGGSRLHIATLARLSVEQLSMNQLVPAGGMTGSFLVIHGMRRRGVPAGLAMEALLVDVLSDKAGFAIVSILSLLAVWWSHHTTFLVLSLFAIFAVMLSVVPLAIWWFLNHLTWTPPRWLGRQTFVARLMEAAAEVSPKRVLSPVLLSKTILLHIGIFLLDAGTLWVMMNAIGTFISPLTAFIALVTASIAGTVSFLPGGVGGFEAGCTATLTLLGVPVEAALTGTLLLRGLTLWLPLIPGWILARGEM